MDNLKKALNILQRYSPPQGEEKNYLFNLGDVHIELKQYEEAKAVFTRLVSLHPQEVAYKIALANSVAKVPKPEEAMGILQDAIRLHPKTLQPTLLWQSFTAHKSAQRMQ